MRRILLLHSWTIWAVLVGFASSAEPVDTTVELTGATVTLGKPRLVAESRGYLWFPTLIQRGQDLLVAASNQADTHFPENTSLFTWSTDGGRTWTAPTANPWGDGAFTAADGRLQLLPFSLRPRGNGEYVSNAVHAPPSTRELVTVADGVRVRGLPAPAATVDAARGISSLRINGDTLKGRDGYFLTTAYGKLEGDEKRRTMLLESLDGRDWRYRSTVATGEHSPSAEGCTESSIVRLHDERVLCVFRRSAYATYGQCWSDDDGRTWTAPRTMERCRSVQPSLTMMKDGAVVLSGGRPGIYVWFNFDGTGENWQELKVHEHHNACVPTCPIAFVEPQKSSHDLRTSSYTQIVPLDERRLLMVYDYLPGGWAALPKDAPAQNQLWCVELTVTRTPSP